MTADLTDLEAAYDAAEAAYEAADAAAEAAYATFEAAREAYVNAKAAYDAASINAVNAALTKASHVTEAGVDALREAWLDDSSN